MLNKEEIKKQIQEEFPNDTALQQIHIARKILSKEAELKGISFLDYIKSILKQIYDPILLTERIL